MSQAINLNELPIQQLQAVRQQLDEEIQVLTRSFAKLRQAQMKFGESIEALRSINSSSENKSLLVPLTNSLYVSGELENSNTVIVDVGTGYYVEKVGYVKSNLSKLEETVQQRQGQRKVLIQVLQEKLAAAAENKE